MRHTLTTAAQVREHFQSDPAAMAALSTEAQATVALVDGRNPKGRIHPEAREAFNASVPASKAYTEGNPATVLIAYKHKVTGGTRRVALAPGEIRFLAAAAGFSPVPARGPLSADLIEAASSRLSEVTE